MHFHTRLSLPGVLSISDTMDDWHLGHFLICVPPYCSKKRLALELRYDRPTLKPSRELGRSPASATVLNPLWHSKLGRRRVTVQLIRARILVSWKSFKDVGGSVKVRNTTSEASAMLGTIAGLRGGKTAVDGVE
jgi:hypothetical protein